jgi:hypothetical protein
MIVPAEDGTAALIGQMRRKMSAACPKNRRLFPAQAPERWGTNFVPKHFALRASRLRNTGGFLNAATRSHRFALFVDLLVIHSRRSEIVQ